MNKKFKLLSITVLTALSLAACANTKDNTKTTTKEVKDKVTHITNEVNNHKYVTGSSFVVGKDLKLLSNNEALDEKKVIEWYLDPLCPACVKLEEIMKDNLTDLTKDGMFIRFNFLSFLSPKSVDDYSNRAAAYMLGVAEFDPNVSMKYFASVMSEEFYPTVASEKTDKEFKDLYIKVGGTEDNWKKITKVHKEFIRKVKEETSRAFNDEILLEKSSTGKLTTPFIIIGNSKKSIDFTQSLDAKTNILDNYKQYYEKLNKEKESTFKVLGVLDSYKVGDTAELEVVTDNKPNSYEWILETSDGKTKTLEEVKSKLSHEISKDDVSITVNTKDSENKVLETKKINFTVVAE